MGTRWKQFHRTCISDNPDGASTKIIDTRGIVSIINTSDGQREKAGNLFRGGS